MKPSNLFRVVNQVKRNLGRFELDYLLSKFEGDINEQAEVVIWRGCPGRKSINTEAIFDLGLRLRGVKTRLVCHGGEVAACLNKDGRENQPVEKWQDLSAEMCVDRARKTQSAYHTNIVFMEDLVKPTKKTKMRLWLEKQSVAELETSNYHGVALGQMTKDSVSRYALGMEIDDYDNVFREYYYTAMMCAEAAKESLRRWKPKVLLMQRHLEYVEWAPTYYVYQDVGIRVVLWSAAITYDNKVTLVDAGKEKLPDLFYISPEAWSKRKQDELSDSQRVLLEKLIRKHRGKWIPQEQIRFEPEWKDNKPVWGVFLHVPYDAGIYPEKMLFSSVEKWIKQTIKVVLSSKNVNWLVKIHPAEQVDAARGTDDMIYDWFGELPKHVKLIEANSPINARDMYPKIDGGVTIQGTVGLELALEGIPVLLAGRAHYANKGFTIDAESKSDYFKKLGEADQIEKLTKQQVELAWKYAYMWFVQRSLELSMTNSKGIFSDLDLLQSWKLLPGKNEVMDLVCDKILNGGEFITDEN